MNEIEMLLRTIAEMSGINQVLGGLQQVSDRAQSVGRGMQVVGSAGVAAGAAIGGALVAATKSAIDHEAQLYQITKQYELSASESAVFAEEMRKVNRELSYMPTEQVYALGAEISAAGFSSEDFARATLMAGQSAASLDISTSSVVAVMASYRNNLDYTLDQTEQMIKVNNLLGNSLSKSPQALFDVQERTLDLAGAMGLAQQEIAVLSASFAELAPTNELGAGAMREFLTALRDMESLDTSALAAMNVDMTTLQETARSGDILGSLKELQSIYGQLNASEQGAFLKAVFGNADERNSVIGSILQASKLTETLSQAASDAGAQQRQWLGDTAGMAALGASQIAELGKAFNDLAVATGQALAPLAGQFAVSLTAVLDSVREFVVANPQVVQGAAMLASALILVGGALVTLGTLLTLASSGLAMIGIAINGILLATSFVAAAIISPVFWIIAAIGLLAGAAYLIITNWSSIVGFFQNLWAQIVAAVQSGVAMARANLLQFSAFLPGWAGIIGNAVNLVVSHWPRISSAVQSAVSAAQGALSSFIGFIQGLALQAGAAAASIGSAIVSGLMGQLGAIRSAASSVAGAIAAVLPGSPVDSGPLRVLNSGYAGGQIAEMIAGGIRQKQGSVADALSSLLTPVAAVAGGGGTTFEGGINFYGDGGNGGVDSAERLMERISQIQKKRDRRKY